MNVVDLFSGSRSFAKVAQAEGCATWTTDMNAFEGIDCVCDVLELQRSDIPFDKVDVLWASPPCTGFSVAAMGHHWNPNRTPRTETAKLGIRLVERTLELIDQIQPTFWFIENPRGMLRKQAMMQELQRHTVTYCQYGDDRMKPTDIWTNSPMWIPRTMCKNGSPCHEAAPRGSKTGTQGRKGNYNRSKVPSELCREVLLSCMQ
jgi:site-specific DNA-cytosine methylase